ncbi:MAG: 4-alpha-glucanotransferase [Phycisphaeraceae bacterium]|nr:4-alpha-glucanotransferase [Phycisphaeraceae bacterium]
MARRRTLQRSARPSAPRRSRALSSTRPHTAPVSPLLLAERSAGVLLHPSSLDGPDGIGDLGDAAHRALRLIHAAGFRAWQMLPIGPVGPGESPYSARSSFAGEPLLVNLDGLVSEGWLSRAELARARGAAHLDAAPRRSARDRKRSTVEHLSARVAWAKVRRFKRSMFAIAYERFLSGGGARSRDYRSFMERSPWLVEWCAFIEAGAESPGEAAFIQFCFERQWRSLQREARALGVRLIGDLPIFVAPDSADVAARPDLFRLDSRGAPTVVTGVPPDGFAPTGQRWGHPHYRWSAHARDDFAWWRSRVRATMERFDLVRIDHFIGFVRAYEVPSRNRTAEHGHWRPAPGTALLAAIQRDLGALPFIAEDLGSVTPAVHALRDGFSLPGMRILQHAFGDGPSPDRPHRHPENSVVYPGTHDNDTTAGWWRSAPQSTKERCAAYAGFSPDASPSDAAAALVRLALGSPARLAVIPMQDLLGLGSFARMNLPGRAKGQWCWRLSSEWISNFDTTAWRRVNEVMERVKKEKKS